eukprot:354400-Chlamydomonas_euryale.AAC.2
MSCEMWHHIRRCRRLWAAAARRLQWLLRFVFKADSKVQTEAWLRVRAGGRPGHRHVGDFWRRRDCRAVRGVARSHVGHTLVEGVDRAPAFLPSVLWLPIMPPLPPFPWAPRPALASRPHPDASTP